ncbi:uncharacterized protein LOC127797034 [Diospyros lotus]|uniref:uncharacterized protein LOC127797034 n=1 Tax=Diospyros lotus TaxID=55363 RepID=UPI00225B7C33|nr:uncharacterized protein LOC127797034 [Diospyros lotus]
MTTTEETDATPAAPDVTHLAAAAVAEAATAAVPSDGELDPEIDTDFVVDPAYATSKQLKEEQDEVAREAHGGGIETLKSVVIISGVVVAVIGALFAVAKKFREA